MVIYERDGILGSEAYDGVVKYLAQIVLRAGFARTPKIVVQWYIEERCLRKIGKVSAGQHARQSTGRTEATHQTAVLIDPRDDAVDAIVVKRSNSGS